MFIQGGSVDVSTYFVLRLAATGVEATGLTIANMDLQYVRTGAAPVAKVDATALAAADTAHTDNYGFEIDATDQPGLYRIDWPDAAFAAGVKQVVLTVKVATCFTEHLAVDIDPPVNLTNILGHLLTQTGTQLADGFQTFFDVASPTTHKAITGVTLAADQAVDVTKWKGAAAPAMTGDPYAEAVALHVHVDKIPQSDGAVSFNSTALAAINAEVDTALNTAIPGSPTADSINERVVAIDAFGAPPAASAIADAVHDEVVEGTTTLRQMLRGFASAMMAKLSGAGTTTVVIRDIGDTKDRITATVDSTGNRSAVTRDLT